MGLQLPCYRTLRSQSRHIQGRDMHTLLSLGFVSFCAVLRTLAPLMMVEFGRTKGKKRKGSGK